MYTKGMAKVAIVGSRDYPRRDLVVRFVNMLEEGDIVVSGGARGVDRWAEEAARARGLKVEIFKADWEGEGRSAGFSRNHDIVLAADRVVAFWDGKSKGTQHTIGLAGTYNKPLEVVYG